MAPPASWRGQQLWLRTRARSRRQTQAKWAAPLLRGVEESGGVRREGYREKGEGATRSDPKGNDAGNAALTLAEEEGGGTGARVCESGTPFSLARQFIPAIQPLPNTSGLSPVAVSLVDDGHLELEAEGQQPGAARALRGVVLRGEGGGGLVLSAAVGGGRGGRRLSHEGRLNPDAGRIGECLGEAGANG